MTKKKIRSLVRQKLRRQVCIGRNPNRPRQWILHVMGAAPFSGRGLKLADAYRALNIQG